ncbi:ribonuclease P protein component [Candidatus Laterigemmans baculatus]|uniref:ribonuclease P protein component n=1 Tax=Candidatus Laterigemmans baculatus TaxID=2770505 RepID=UPI0013DA9D13|nr:ribonuclease P protein component [Candidatus Laterigemmans baculatus]
MTNPTPTPSKSVEGRHRFPKRRRIASGEDFTAIIGSGSFAADETLIVNALPSNRLRRGRGVGERSKSADAPQPSVGELQAAGLQAAGLQAAGLQAAGPQGTGLQAVGRLGVTIPRKAGGAVVRNRWKRLIREAYRQLQHELPAGFDFVVRPRRGAVAEFGRVQQSLRRLAVRAASAGPSPPPNKRQPNKHSSGKHSSGKRR